MKRFAMFSILAVLLAAGCRAQVPQSASVYGCPSNPTTNVAYQPLNPVGSATNPPVSGLTYVDKPATGTYCYVLVAYDPIQKQYSGPSNTAGPFTLKPINTEIDLSWIASSTAGVSYVVSRAAASLIAPPSAPVLNTNPTIAGNGAIPPGAIVSRYIAAPSNLKIQ